jgi:two-component system, CitB family, sensor kinase
LKGGAIIASRKVLFRVASNRIFIVSVAVVLGLILAYNSVRSNQENQDELRALAIAKATAAIPGIPDLLKSGDPEGELAALGEKIRVNTGAAYIVIADAHAIRFSHPNPLMIGQRLDGEQPALSGKSYTTINRGTLGVSINGKTPIYNASGQIVGLVSAGILLSQLTDEGSALLRTFLFYGFGLLVAGLLLSELLVRLARSRKLSDELEEVTTQFQEREAMLHSIREGVITLTPENRITLVNDEAIRLLDFKTNVLGKSIGEVIPIGRLRSLLIGEVESDDDFRVLTDKFSILINRRPVFDGNRTIGSVVTLRDRTEHIELLRELESVQNFSEALRSQQHEFANRIHVLNGLLELGKYVEASQFLGEIASVQSNLAEDLNIKLGNSLIAALLIAKVTVARERGVKLAIEVATSIDDLSIDQNALVTVIGNLVDNAIDAASGSPRAEVSVLFEQVDPETKIITVHDSGPGLPEKNPEIVFEDGYSTKPSRGAGHRGLGLAIVRRLVAQCSGTIIASNEGGATFWVQIPTLRVERLRDIKP